VVIGQGGAPGNVLLTAKAIGYEKDSIGPGGFAIETGNGGETVGSLKLFDERLIEPSTSSSGRAGSRGLTRPGPRLSPSRPSLGRPRPLLGAPVP
jgi:hypothetical protein